MCSLSTVSLVHSTFFSGFRFRSLMVRLRFSGSVVTVTVVSVTVSLNPAPASAMAKAEEREEGMKGDEAPFPCSVSLGSKKIGIGFRIVARILHLLFSPRPGPPLPHPLG